MDGTILLFLLQDGITNGAIYALLGIALGAVAVLFVSGEGHGGPDAVASSHDARAAQRAIAVALLAGLLIGGFLVTLARVQPGASGWPLVMGRASASVVLWALVLLRRAPVALDRTARAPMLGATITDVGGNILRLLARAVSRRSFRRGFRDERFHQRAGAQPRPPRSPRTRRRDIQVAESV